jgi:ketol-acid reductoisomerase
MKHLFVKLLIGAFMTLGVPMQVSSMNNFSSNANSAEVALPSEDMPDVVIDIQTVVRPDGTIVVTTSREIILDGKVVASDIDVVIIAPKKQ